ncbi:transcription elongation factor A N-terminal and central domain-containing protein [Discoglossus pictus]
MLEEKVSKEFISRAFQVERILPERKYEDIALHLNYFERAEVTLEVFQQTDIVRVVYRVLKSCPEGALKKKAKCLLSKWKALYRRESHIENTIQEKCLMNEDKAKSVVKASIKEIPCGDEVLALEGTSNLPCSVTQEQDSLNTESSSQESCSNQSTSTGYYIGKKTVTIDEALRTKCTDLLCQALAEPTECQEKTQNLAKEIEENIYILNAGNDKKYRNCIRSKVSNIKNPKNSHLRKHIFSGALSPEEFAKMSPMEMANEELKKLRASYTEACVQEHQLPQGVDGVQTNKIKCRRCEKFNCTVTMISRGTLFLPGWVRTGNPDEELMTFVTCNECGEKWYHSRWVCL